MTREQKIAHLEIHGWRPVREIPSAMNGHGIYNDREGWGVRVTAFGTTRKLEPGAAMEDVDWDYINDAKLDVLVRAATEWAEAP